MTKIVIPTTPGMGRSLIDHDPKNKMFRASGTLFAESAPLLEKTWRGHYAYDQGRTPWCVAYTGKGMLNRQPFSLDVPYDVRYDHSFAHFYNGAQRNDEWGGEAYDGTSANGLLKFLKQEGTIREYRWCFGIDDVLRTLSHHGPVGIGTWWSQNMNYPDRDTHLINFSGQWVGGHQWQAIGIDPAKEEVIAINSWGKNWGDRGRFRLKFHTLEMLLKEDGDAHTLVTI